MNPIHYGLTARFLSLTALVLFSAFLRQDPIYLDIYSQETDRDLVFGNAHLELRVDKRTGEWTAWTTKPNALSLLTPDPKRPAVDVSINGTYLIAKHGGTYLRHEFSVDKNRQGGTLSVTVGVLPQQTGFAYELTTYYRLHPQQNRLERWAKLVRHKPGATEHFDGFRFQLPGLTVGRQAETTLTVPGAFFPKTFVAPDTPYDSLKAKTINFHQAPDANFGVLLLTNTAQRTSLGSWMNTGGEVAYTTAIQGNGQTITARHDDKRAYYLLPGRSVESDTHHVEMGSSAAEVMQAYRRMATETMPLDAATPAWVKQQVILEVYPKYYKGGFREITARLPFYKQTGFTMIYLMPHWQGGYGPMDLFAVDPAFGTPADLTALVKTAHSLGMKVIFDMVIHGFNKKSPLPQQRPELFVRNEAGELALHPTWKSITTDWANPAYQQYMVDLVLHDQREYGMDGYRVDAATYKGAGWNPNVSYPAYRDGSAAPELMQAMLTALRKKNPEAVLLSEVFGPVFHSVCNFAHDNQTEAVPFLQRKMQQGTYTAADYKQHVQSVYALLPDGANRVFFARNHDTSWFYKFDGYTPRYMAFEAVHALFGIPEVFAGDPKNLPAPDDDPGVYDTYRKLFAFRKQHPQFTSGAVLLDQVQCDNKHVFSGIRGTSGQYAMALISFSEQPQKATITLDAALKVPRGKPLKLSDVQTGKSIVLMPAGPNAYAVTLEPFQRLAGKL